MRRYLALPLLLLLGTALAAGTLTEPATLEKNLKQPGLRILDARPLAEYAKGHLPGAVHVEVKDWQALGKKEGGLRNAKAWGEKVGQLGIGHKTSVVVYGSNLPNTARVWWLLKYLGIRNVTILDGGWELWAKDKRPVDVVAPKIEPMKFEPKFQADRLEEMDTLKKAVQGGKVTIVDTRSTEEFTGKKVLGKRGGHIPGAKLLEWKELVAPDGRFKSPKQLRALFKQRGIEPDQTTVCYCQTGGRASVEVFALELAGYPKVKLFVRGWEQWGADKAPADEASKKEDLDQLQGTWMLVSAERDGKKLPEIEVKKTKITFRGDTFLFPDASGIGTSKKGVIKLDPSKTPKWMDAREDGDAGEGKVSLGIYEIKGDDYKVCFSPPGKDRPTEIASKKGSGHVLQVWKREKK